MVSENILLLGDERGDVKAFYFKKKESQTESFGDVCWEMDIIDSFTFWFGDEKQRKEGEKQGGAWEAGDT